MSGTGAAKGHTLFDLAGGHPALDLVNSLDNRFRHDGPNEVLVGYDELLRFLGESALLDTQTPSPAERERESERQGCGAGVAIGARAAGSRSGGFLRRRRPGARGPCARRHQNPTTPLPRGRPTPRVALAAGGARRATPSCPTSRGNGPIRTPRIQVCRCGSFRSRSPSCCYRTAWRNCEPARWTPAAGSSST